MRTRLIPLAFVFLTTGYTLGCAQNTRDDPTPAAARDDSSYYLETEDKGEVREQKTRSEPTATVTRDDSSYSSDPENTRRNVRDKDEATLTPTDQEEDETDLKITAAIRRAIVKDDSLSTNAHNVKIITRDKVVTLRGPVESEAEKAKVGKLAQRAAGVRKVYNQLEVDAD